MVTRVATVLAAAALLVACSRDSQSVDLADDERAGEVMAVEGRAFAERDGAEVTLEVGDDVLAGDTLVTEEGAALTVRLDHNGARWTLDGGSRRAVRESAAWRAPTSSEGLASGDPDDRTGAAGRQAEREAADTRATAVRAERETAAADDTAAGSAPETAPPPAADPEPEETAAPAPPPPPPKRDSRRRSHRTKRGSGDRSNRGPGGGGSDDDIDDLLNNALSGDKKRDGVTAESSSVVPETLSRDAVVRVIKGARSAYMRCYDQAREDDDSQGGKLTVAFVVAPTGKVTRADVEVTSGTFSASMQGCVASVFKGLRFPTFGGTEKAIRYPLAFGD